MNKRILELQLVGYFGRNLLEADGSARYPFETNTVQGEPW